MHLPPHAFLAHFPVAFFLGASACDLMTLATGDPLWWPISQYALLSGEVIGLATLVAGAAEIFLRNIPREALVVALAHVFTMVIALVLFVVSSGIRGDEPPGTVPIVLGLAGSAILLLGAFLGGTLVFRFGVGMSPASRQDVL